MIRPTSDRVREAMFNILRNEIQGAKVLDLFAGTGSFGLEALSRGAVSAVFVDQYLVSLDLIRTNLQNCFKHADAEIIRLNLAKETSYQTLANRLSSGNNQFNIIFLDPPYEKNLAEMTLRMVEKNGFPAINGYVIAEERANVNLPDNVGTLTLLQRRHYGETGIWIYKKEP